MADLSYTFDKVGNVKSISDHFTSSRSVNGLGYDGLDRLTVANGPWGSGSFSYDKKGNLLTKKLGSLGQISYQYNATNNRLISTSGIPYNFQYDQYGNVTNNGRFQMTYDHSGDLLNIKTTASPVTSVATVDIDYEYDGQGLRAVEITNDKAIYQVHSQGGNVLYEEDWVDHKATDYVYFDGKVLAEIESDIDPVYYCDAGWTLEGSTCSRDRSQAAAKSCPSGYSQSGSVCSKTTTKSINYSCPSGYSLSGTSCVKSETIDAVPSCSLVGGKLRAEGDWYICYNEDRPAYRRTAIPICRSGWDLDYNSKTCSRTLTSTATASCPSGYSINGNSCKKTVTTSITYICPAGKTLSGTNCLWTETKAANEEGL